MSNKKHKVLYRGYERSVLTKVNPFEARIEISVFTDISVLQFYGYIGNIGEISVDIFS